MGDLHAQCKEKNVMLVGTSVPWEQRIGLGGQLCAKFPGSCVLRGFGDTVEDAVAQHVGVTVGLLRTARDAPIETLGGLTGSQLIDQWDTALRAIHPDMWILPLERWLSSLLKEKSKDAPLLIVILDVRFPNEAAWMTRVGGLLVHLGQDPAPPGFVHTTASPDAGVQAAQILALVAKHGEPTRAITEVQPTYDPDRDVCALL